MASNQDRVTPIKIGARSSPLSQAQVAEVIEEVHRYHPSVEFEPIYVMTQGDRDQKTSLRSLGKTDFFTHEVDHLLLSGQCRIAVHSAKDLPEPLPAGLTIVALTKGVNAHDVLVMREGESFETLPAEAVIATSSERREEAVRSLRPDLRFVDLRGTIAQRLAKLDLKEADGVVVAEAALIRLKLTHLNRIKVPSTTPLQGQLAILARAYDHEMRFLFYGLDCRKKWSTLYLGLELPESLKTSNVIHYPIIQVVPRPFEEEDIQSGFKNILLYTHLVFTSKSAVSLFINALSHFEYFLNDLADKCVIAVGKSTATRLEQCGLSVAFTAEEETAEGIVQLFRNHGIDRDCFVFWPHSALSRPVLRDFFQGNSIRFQECILYDTKHSATYPLPNLDQVDEIVFTSPSTVLAFNQIFGYIPKDKQLTAIGPITTQALDNAR